jgi:hypothetical protein
MIGFLALLAVSLQAAPQAAAAPPAPAAAAVSIPFNPPLGRPLCYRMTRTIAKPNGTVEARVDYEIGFSRQSEGFRMNVRTRDFDVTPVPPDAMAAVRPLVLELLQPFSVRLDADGRMIEVEDGDAYVERMLATLERRTRELGLADAALIGLVAGISRGMTAEQKMNALTMYIAPALEFAAFPLVVGETLESEVETPALFGPGTFRQRATILPQRIEGDLLHIRVESSIPAEETRRALLAAVDAVPVTGEGRNTAEQRARSRAQLAAMEFSRASEEDYAVETGTGLTRRHRSVERTAARSSEGAATQTDTRVLERID